MALWGSNPHAGGLDQIQAEAWKSVFKSLDSNPQAFILFDREYRVLGRNQAAALLAERLTEKSLAVGDSLLNLFSPSSTSSTNPSKKPGKASTPLGFLLGSAHFRYISRL